MDWYKALMAALCDADKRQEKSPEIGGTVEEWRRWADENLR